MNNITFGQYVPGDSWVYKLDPRVKIILTILLIVILFLIPNLIGMFIALVAFLVMFLSTRISLWKVIKGLRPVLFLLAFTIVLQLIYTTGNSESVLYNFNMQIGLFQLLILIGIFIFYLFTKKFIPLKIIYLLVIAIGMFLILWLVKFDSFVWKDFNFIVYKEGVDNAVFIFVRIVLMIGITSLLTLSTMSIDINNGLEGVLSPLKLLKINVGIFSMLVSLTLRFIPTLLMESKKIMNAQASRGVDFQEGKLKDKVVQIISLLIPMFVISFKRAEDLSNAMETRGYIIGAKRTKLDELKLRWRDYVAIFISLALLALVIWSRFYV
ncbi:TPA: energy-coupling factor transporter transmembrane protein EcfT [Candidatus Avacholeplasma faecigallinarum]|nr:energy-coupling factor transporter transmembrane protein EcfT [Candidatus Avacholeplasma faecigallinarum]